MSTFTTSTSTATEVVGAFSERTSPPRNGSNRSLNASGSSDDDALASFEPDFSLMENRSPNDDERSIGLASTTGRYNNSALGLGASGRAPTTT